MTDLVGNPKDRFSHDAAQYLVTQASRAQDAAEKHILGGLILHPHLQNRRRWAGLTFVRGSIYHNSPVLFDNC